MPRPTDHEFQQIYAATTSGTECLACRGITREDHCVQLLVRLVRWDVRRGEDGEAGRVHPAAAASAPLVSANGAVTFLAAHIVRRVAMLVVVVPVIGVLARRRAERTGRPVGIQILAARYAVAGVVIGGAWIWHAGASLWEHALRVVVILLVVAPLIKVLRQWRARRTGRPPRYLPVKQLVVAKLALIVVAVGLQAALDQATSVTTASVIVGVAMAVTIAVAGPLLQRHLIRRRLTPP